MAALRSLLVLCALLVAAPSCAAPLQNGGVRVRPGVEGRLDLMCRYRAADAAEVCAAPEEE
jgi:hypothetical protein